MWQRLASRAFKGAPLRRFSMAPDDIEEETLGLMNARQLSDYHFERATRSIVEGKTSALDRELEKLRGLRLGFSHQDSTYKKFALEFADYLPKMNEVERAKMLEHLYQIGIKDPSLWRKIYRFIEANFEHDSYDSLLAGVSTWEDNDFFEYNLLLQDSFKKKFMDKTKGLLKKLLAEDLVKATFIIDSWNYNVDAPMELLKRVDFDNLNSKKVFSVNVYPKLAFLLAKHKAEGSAIKILEMMPINTTLAYDQILQAYELGSPHGQNLGVYDPLNWKSLALYSRSILKTGLLIREFTHYIDEAIRRKSEIQICDLTSGPWILKDMQEVLQQESRQTMIQMLTQVVIKERDLVSLQMSPETTCAMFAVIKQEADRKEVSLQQLSSLAVALAQLIIDGEFDGQLVEIEAESGRAFKNLIDSIPEEVLLNKKELVDYIEEQAIDSPIDDLSKTN